MIRLSGGKYRSRVIETPDSSTTLPTKNMVRGAMLSVLFSVKDDVVLDLYAGSGALGLEALSRGAKHGVFVEKDAKAARIVRKNIESLKENNAEVINSDNASALVELKKKGRVFTLVFLDPPYANKASYQQDVDFLINNGMLSNEARLILEFEGEIPFDASAFAFSKEYRYGKTKFLYLKRKTG